MTLTPATRNGILPMPRRAYSYLRVSDDHQVKGDGLRRQNDFAATLCAEEGWCLDDTLRFEDHGVSGFHGDNARVGQLSRFLDLVKARRIAPGSVLIVECIDRLSREQVPEAYDLFRSILRAGIWIATREPRRIYRPDDDGNLLAVVEPLLIMARAHEESQIKSVRIGAAWAKKRDAARSSAVPHGKRCPAWIEYTPTGYRLIPHAANTVRAVFRLAREGLAPAASSLGSDPGPTFIPHSAPSPSGRASTSAAFSAAARPSANTSPAAAPNASPCPAASASATHYRTTTPPPSPPGVGAVANAARAGRRRAAGRPGSNEANLFTGIVYEATSRERMALHPHTSGPSTTTPLPVPRRPPPRPQARPRPRVHLRAVRAMRTGHGRPTPPPRRATARRPARRAGGPYRHPHRPSRHPHPARARHRNPTCRPGQCERRPRPRQALNRLATDRAAASSELEALKMDSLTGRAEQLGETHSLLDLLQEAKGAPDEADLRRRVKAALRLVVNQIWVYVQPVTNRLRVVHVQIYLRSGQRRYIRIPTANLPGGFQPLELSDSDFRTGHIPHAAADSVFRHSSSARPAASKYGSPGPRNARACSQSADQAEPVQYLPAALTTTKPPTIVHLPGRPSHTPPTSCPAVSRSWSIPLYDRRAPLRLRTPRPPSRNRISQQSRVVRVSIQFIGPPCG